MLLTIADILDAGQLEHIRGVLCQVDWSDGRGSAGYLSGRVKDNRQLPDRHPEGLKLAEIILRALDGSQQFTSAALPRKIVPPLFNRYDTGQSYGAHIDGAIRPVEGTSLRVRTDLSATLFLSPPEDYEGGELVIEDTFGPRRVKLQAGHMVLYPAGSVHHVAPVTRGTRLASFFWIESMVRSDAHRSILFELDRNIQDLATRNPEEPALVRLAGVYHNLMREWSES